MPPVHLGFGVRVDCRTPLGYKWSIAGAGGFTEPIGVRGTFGSSAEVKERIVRGYTGDKDAYLKRLRRIEGQIRGLQRMVESDEYCIDVLTQISAATKALQSVSLGLMDEHLRHCVAEAVAQGGDTADEKVREASEAIARLVRS
jgi:DNA-binding FrmR family transcriptional regulator